MDMFRNKKKKEKVNVQKQKVDVSMRYVLNYRFFKKLFSKIYLTKNNIYLQPVKSLRVCLVHCNDYYMGIGISISRNILSWNVICITIHQFDDHLEIES